MLQYLLRGVSTYAFKFEINIGRMKQIKTFIFGKSKTLLCAGVHSVNNQHGFDECTDWDIY